MTKFIKLIELGNDRVNYINVDHIAIVCKDADEDTMLMIREVCIYFKESPEEVMKLIEEKN